MHRHLTGKDNLPRVGGRQWLLPYTTTALYYYCLILLLPYTTTAVYDYCLILLLPYKAVAIHQGAWVVDIVRVGKWGRV